MTKVTATQKYSRAFVAVFWLSVGVILSMGISATPAIAEDEGPKRVIYVEDDSNDSGAAEMALFYYQQNPVAGFKDQIMREVDDDAMLDALKKINDGDMLIIIAHGSPGGINIDGVHRDGFRSENDEKGEGGTGKDCNDPQTVQKLKISGVSVTFATCYGDADPDPNDPDKRSVAQTLRELLGEDNSVEGSEHVINVSSRFIFEGIEIPEDLDDLTEEEVKILLATFNCLNDAWDEDEFDSIWDWMDSFDTVEEQQNALNTAIKDCDSDQAVAVQILYDLSERPPNEKMTSIATTLGFPIQRSKSPCAECGPSGAPCPADITGTGVVNVDDLLLVLNNWGPCVDPTVCPADITGTGIVNVDDLLIILNNWGPCP